MNIKQTNYLNIGLMLISLVLATTLPFELFLFSYAILGPLHYLTEIHWLKEKKFFIKEKSDLITFLILSGIILILSQIGNIALFQTQALAIIFSLGFYILFILCFNISLTNNKTYRLYLIIAAFVFLLILFSIKNLFLLFMFYVPTLIHVYIFTGAFILLGSLKSKSISGYLSLIVFLTCPLLCFILYPHFHIENSSYIFHSYDLTLNTLNHFTQTVFHNQSSEFNLLITRFFAFAYTYHYLNWFSKTNVIKWHKIPKKYLLIILLLWFTSIMIYAYDYVLGFKVLFALSFLHVILEFPLNHQSFIQIFQEIKKRVLFS
jgi:hypothetical protein